MSRASAAPAISGSGIERDHGAGATLTRAERIPSIADRLALGVARWAPPCTEPHPMRITFEHDGGATSSTDTPIHGSCCLLLLLPRRGRGRDASACARAGPMAKSLSPAFPPEGQQTQPTAALPSGSSPRSGSSSAPSSSRFGVKADIRAGMLLPRAGHGAAGRVPPCLHSSNRYSKPTERGSEDARGLPRRHRPKLRGRLEHEHVPTEPNRPRQGPALNGAVTGVLPPLLVQSRRVDAPRECIRVQPGI
jgi:hypothetical protein